MLAENRVMHHRISVFLKLVSHIHRHSHDGYLNRHRHDRHFNRHSYDGYLNHHRHDRHFNRHSDDGYLNRHRHDRHLHHHSYARTRGSKFV